MAALAAPVAARAFVSCLAHSCRSQKPRSGRDTRLAVRSAAAPVATDLQAELSSPAAVRKALLARGWDLAWIDGVTGEMQKKRLKATVPQIEAAVSYLESLGIPLKAVENMASTNKLILGQSVEAMQAVVDYAQRAGVSGESLVLLLEAHPNLLTYAVSADGKQLEKGLARASIDVVEKEGRRVAGVSYYREGTSFQAAPVSPYKPSPL